MTVLDNTPKQIDMKHVKAYVTRATNFLTQLIGVFDSIRNILNVSYKNDKTMSEDSEVKCSSNTSILNKLKNCSLVASYKIDTNDHITST